MKHILIVDDDPELAEMMKDILSARGYIVTLAENGLAAIEASKLHRIDLILMDVRMPFLSGTWYCNAFKEKMQTRNIPIVMVSGLTVPEEIEKAYKAGACDYLKKPFRSEDLLRTVEKHLV